MARSSWNFGLPHKGEPPAPKQHPLEAIRQGRRWHGHWHVEGPMLYVSSAYGSKTEPIGRRKDLEARASVLFGQILDGR